MSGKRLFPKYCWYNVKEQIKEECCEHGKVNGNIRLSISVDVTRNLTTLLVF